MPFNTHPQTISYRCILLFFTIGDLFLLHKGGRVGAATAVVEAMLSIKPILIVDEAGKLTVIDRVRGRKASIQKLLDMTLETIRSPEKQTIYIGQAGCMDDALYLKSLVEERLPCKEVVIAGIGPVVGPHTRPSHLCLFS